jgi:hypothetical protein
VLVGVAVTFIFGLKWSLGRTLAGCVVLGAATSLLPS